MRTVLARRLVYVVLLSGIAGWANSPLPDEDAPPVPIRWAHGRILEGAIQGTNTEGIVVQTSRDLRTIPWKHLSVGTRYRMNAPF